MADGGYQPIQRTNNGMLEDDALSLLLLNSTSQAQFKVLDESTRSFLGNRVCIQYFVELGPPFPDEASRGRIYRSGRTLAARCRFHLLQARAAAPVASMIHRHPESSAVRTKIYSAKEDL